MKMFWKKTEGFTLVELIVVIAILGILAGVGTVGYSGYVKKANMAADQQLVSSVKSALELAAYSDPEFEGGIVALSLTEKPDVAGNESLADALEKNFGAGWETNEAMRLKYDGWSATFQGSNFYDKDDGLKELMGTVDTLTDALGVALENPTISDGLTGGAFSTYVDELEADTTAKKADAAVFYVADTTGKVSAENLQDATDAMIAVMLSGGGPEDCLAAMDSKLNSTLASTAALYALAKGYANFFEDNYETPADLKSPSAILSETTDDFTDDEGRTTLNQASDAYKQLMSGFGQMAQVNGDALTEYMSKHMASDINAYAEAMKMVSASKESIVNNNDVTLGSEGYFSTPYVSKMVSAYADGGIFVYALKKNGAIQITSSIDVSEG